MSTLSHPRRPGPSHQTPSPKSPLSPDGGVFDIMSLPKVYARAAGIGMRSPPLSADKETFGTISAGEAVGTGGMTKTSGQAGQAGQGKRSKEPGLHIQGGSHDQGVGVDRKGKGKAVEVGIGAQDDPFLRHTPTVAVSDRSDPSSLAAYPAGPDSPARSYSYAPPQRPLSPHQLSRIAQSFGIAIPSSPSSLAHSAGSPRNIHPKQHQEGASPIASSSRITLDSPIRPSSYLVHVVPPASLLSADPSDGAMGVTEAEKQKWARGRLVPLQRTYAGMMAAIAREFGLPGVVGLEVYLSGRDGTATGLGQEGLPVTGDGAHCQRHPLAGVSEAPITSGREHGGEAGPSGPMITPSTWSALFGQYIASHSPSRGTTPIGTPRTFQLRHDAPSQLSLPGTLTGSPFKRSRPARSHVALSSHPSSRAGPSIVPDPNQPVGSSEDGHNSYSLISDTSTSSDSSASLVTPPFGTSVSSSPSTTLSANPHSAIIATLELDLDPHTKPPWLGEWNRRLGQARASGRGLPLPSSSCGIETTGARGGVRELRLPGKVKEGQSPRFIRQMEEERRNAAHADAAGAGAIPTIHIHARQPSSSYADRDPSANTNATAIPAGGLGGDLLASPINLALSPDMALAGGLGGGALTKSMLLTDEERDMLQRELAKRGSALVMSDQLDDLEKMMRQLSPRNISMTSPRTMTPRTAAKVASSTLTMPAPSKHALNGSARKPFPVSPLSSTTIPSASHDPDVPLRAKTTSSSSTNTTATTASTSRATPIPHAAWAITANKSAASINTFATTASALSSVPSFDATTLSRAPMEAAYDEEEIDISSPRERVRKSSGLRASRTNGGGNVSSGEYFQSAVMQSKEQEREREEEGVVMSPGGTGVRGFLSRSRSKSRSKGKSKVPVVAVPMSVPSSAIDDHFTDAALPGSRRPGDGSTEKDRDGKVQGQNRANSWKPSRPQRPPSPDFDDPAWSATLSSPEFAFDPDMAEQVQSQLGSPRTPGSFSPFASVSNGHSPAGPVAGVKGGIGERQAHGTPKTPGSGTPGTPLSADSTDTPRANSRLSPNDDTAASAHLHAGGEFGSGPGSGERKKPRSGSISLKGLRHMGSRSFGRKDREKERPPALPLSAGTGSNGRTSDNNSHSASPGVGVRAGGQEEGEAVGLFAGQVSPQRSTFPGLRSVSSGHGSGAAVADSAGGTGGTGKSDGSGAGEFGRINHAEPAISPGQGAMPTSASSTSVHGQGQGKENGFSRLFGFGNRKSSETARSGDLAGGISGGAGPGGSGTNVNGNGNGLVSGFEKRMAGSKVLAGLGIGSGHSRGKSSDTTSTSTSTSRLGFGLGLGSAPNGKDNLRHPGAIRSISGPVDVSMTSSASAFALQDSTVPTGGRDGETGTGTGKLSALRGSPSYNSFAQAQQAQQALARGSSDTARPAAQGGGSSGWDGLAELHRATTASTATASTALPATGVNAAPTPTPASPSPASPRSVRRKPVPGHA